MLSGAKLYREGKLKCRGRICCHSPNLKHTCRAAKAAWCIACRLLGICALLTALCNGPVSEGSLQQISQFTCFVVLRRVFVFVCSWASLLGAEGLFVVLAQRSPSEVCKVHRLEAADRHAVLQEHAHYPEQAGRYRRHLFGASLGKQEPEK